jgi:DNA mismatch repair ATPase MutS
VARLCILREDLYLETMALMEESIPSLDKNSPPWRLMYFWRNSIRTLLEIRSALETLQKDKEFLDSISVQPEKFQEAFNKLVHKIRTAHEFLKDVRNEIGGHVQLQAVQEALEHMDMDSNGLIELGPVIAESHHRFASQLVGQILLRDVPNESWESHLNEILGKTAELSAALEAIDIVLLAYMDARRLWE